MIGLRWRKAHVLEQNPVQAVVVAFGGHDGHRGHAGPASHGLGAQQGPPLLALVTLGHWALATASAFGLGVLFEGLGLPVFFPALCFIAMAIGCAAIFWAFAVFLLLSAPDQD